MLVHDCNPESMRMVPRVCPAGGDSVPADPRNGRIELFCAFLSKIRPEAKTCNDVLGASGGNGPVPEIFPFLFNLMLRVQDPMGPQRICFWTC